MCACSSIGLMQCSLAHQIEFVRASCVSFHTLPFNNKAHIRSNLISHVFSMNTDFPGPVLSRQNVKLVKWEKWHRVYMPQLPSSILDARSHTRFHPGDCWPIFGKLVDKSMILAPWYNENICTMPVHRLTSSALKMLSYICHKGICMMIDSMPKM